VGDAGNNTLHDTSGDDFVYGMEGMTICIAAREMII